MIMHIAWGLATAVHQGSGASHPRWQPPTLTLAVAVALTQGLGGAHQRQ